MINILMTELNRGYQLHVDIKFMPRIFFYLFATPNMTLQALSYFRILLRCDGFVTAGT